MLGAIAGDIIGSIYEHCNIKTTEFPLFHPSCRFTDDTVLTVALADSLVHGTRFVDLMRRVGGRGRARLRPWTATRALRHSAQPAGATAGEPEPWRKENVLCRLASRGIRQ